MSLRDQLTVSPDTEASALPRNRTVASPRYIVEAGGISEIQRDLSEGHHIDAELPLPISISIEVEPQQFVEGIGAQFIIWGTHSAVASDVNAEPDSSVVESTEQ